MTKGTLKKIHLKVLTTILLMSIGSIVGFLSATIFLKLNGSKIFEVSQHSNIFFLLFKLYFIIFISIVFQTIVHESGHLVCGLLSKYKFVSFRIGSFTLIKENNKFKLKKFKIIGTGGQCLLMPIEKDYTKQPFLLYNLGGSLFNLIISLLLLLPTLILKEDSNLIAFLSISSSIGVLSCLINIIPLKLGGIANDGYNILSLRKNPTAREAFFKVMYINGLLQDGKNFTDFSVDLFNIPENADLNNSLTSSLFICKANYYLYKKDFMKAKELFEYIINNTSKLIGFYKLSIYSELLFIEIITENRQDEIDRLYTKDLKRFMKQMKYSLGFKRILYSYELLVQKDKVKADTHLKSFEKLCSTTPSKGEIVSESAIIDYINEIILNKVN